ncbi:unnamed protein product [Closterium sp. Naga37s-1]|nr:unnamed protein product [Closterium sp. Naga37s-1]
MRHALEHWTEQASSTTPPPPVMPAELAAVVERRLSAVLARHQQLEELLSQPDTSPDDLARAGKEMSDLAPAVAIALELQKKTKELEDLHALLKGQGQPYNEDKDTKGGKTEGGREADEEDEELRAMVWEEIGVVGGERQALLRSAVRRILPKDEADSRGCIVEVRAGTGGDEAALFAADVFQIAAEGADSAAEGADSAMLQRVATTEKAGRAMCIQYEHPCEGVFGWLKWESGVHRVQRVPATEKSGRVHTSAATVAVLPQADEVSGAEGYRTVQCRTGGRVWVAQVGEWRAQGAAGTGYGEGRQGAHECCYRGCAAPSRRGERCRIVQSGAVQRVAREHRVDVSIRQEDVHIDTYCSGGQEDLRIDTQEDLRIDTYRSGGCGGQSVNTTNSAVRITHLPTGLVVAIQDERSQHMVRMIALGAVRITHLPSGLVVAIQDERSQHMNKAKALKNKAKALKVLRARLFDLQRKQAEASRSQLRHGQIGSGDRSERIRTYNFPQGRITDHRVGVTLHSLPQVLQGEGLETFIEALEAAAEKEAIDGLAKAG